MPELRLRPAQGAGLSSTSIREEAASDKLVRRYGIVGGAEYAERLRRSSAIGVERVWIGAKGVGVDVKERNAHRIAREVGPSLVRR